MQIYLASTSPYRKAQLAPLLSLAGTLAPEIDESIKPLETAEQLARRLSEEKALAGLTKLTAARPLPRASGLGLELELTNSPEEGPETEYLIIAGDQTATCRDQLLAKPGSLAKAREQLQLLAGATANFYSGVSVLHCRGREASRVKTAVTHTAVEMRKLSEREIDCYLARENVLACAGSFKCEGLGISLFKRIESSDPSALIGLPLIALSTILRELGYDPICGP